MQSLDQQLYWLLQPEVLHTNAVLHVAYLRAPGGWHPRRDSGDRSQSQRTPATTQNEAKAIKYLSDLFIVVALALNMVILITILIFMKFHIELILSNTTTI